MFSLISSLKITLLLKKMKTKQKLDSWALSSLNMILSFPIMFSLHSFAVHGLWSLFVFPLFFFFLINPTPVLLPGKSLQRSLVGCSPWRREESDRTKQLPFHFLLSCIGEGSGNPLQCSCLENPRDGRARWASVCGVAQSWTRLKRLSSSSTSSLLLTFLHSSFFNVP